ncbi:molybdopterin synthase catalytic subunit MoaE [Microbulbifer rhizosphaerae]|uniref:Molybdopterin synthase catalytic subunit n=1 Tax=Microbulbifer rhizosphaerae TaxID=1562603 RepID=A0A7W4W8Y1_9GAMM|nr:molybdopterin synthase catalytic subunit MoaE [Microbulbifer rhizosphaerae]MBB3059649.1 molybdopterin synthase catalytic subunit [Microbulbifer rhizosphaerae]
MAVSVAVQLEAFDVGAEYARLREGNTRDGAAAMFVGSVRDFNLGTGVSRLELEHYPGMTERVLGDIAEQARQRWQLGRVCIVHRIGPLDPGEDIVFVGATAEHRQAALDACAFIMDWLKSRAPFWKKERGPGGERWVEARESDQEALEKW